MKKITWQDGRKVVSTIKNSGLSKDVVVLRKLIVWTSIALLAVSLCLSEANKRMPDNVSSFKFFKETFILSKLYRSFCLFLENKGNSRRSGRLFHFLSHNHT